MAGLSETSESEIASKSLEEGDPTPVQGDEKAAAESEAERSAVCLHEAIGAGVRGAEAEGGRQSLTIFTINLLLLISLIPVASPRARDLSGLVQLAFSRRTS